MIYKEILKQSMYIKAILEDNNSSRMFNHNRYFYGGNPIPDGCLMNITKIIKDYCLTVEIIN